jgi:hypothetical protein
MRLVLYVTVNRRIFSVYACLKPFLQNLHIERELLSGYLFITISSRLRQAKNCTEDCRKCSPFYRAGANVPQIRSKRDAAISITRMQLSITFRAICFMDSRACPRVNFVGFAGMTAWAMQPYRVIRMSVRTNTLMKAKFPGIHFKKINGSNGVSGARNLAEASDSLIWEDRGLAPYFRTAKGSTGPKSRRSKRRAADMEFWLNCGLRHLINR